MGWQFFDSRSIKSKDWGMRGVDWKLFDENKVARDAAVIQRCIDWLVKSLMDVLQDAIPRTPVDSGKLRRSGTASIYYGLRDTKGITIARGLKSGGVRILSGMNKLTPHLARRYRKRASQMYGSVKFFRIASEGSDEDGNSKGLRDIALWAHEDLLAYEDRPETPAARTPGTGPKYLERAVKKFQSRRSADWRRIERIVEQDFNEISVPVGKPGTKYTWQRLKHDLNRLKRFKFWGGRK